MCQLYQREVRDNLANLAESSGTGVTVLNDQKKTLLTGEKVPEHSPQHIPLRHGRLWLCLRLHTRVLTSAPISLLLRMQEQNALDALVL